LNTVAGEVMGQRHRRHRAREIWVSLRRTEDAMPADLDVQLAMNNYGIQKIQQVKGGLARRARFHVHFTPTSASWVNTLER
jgi:hypothetical protein